MAHLTASRQPRFAYNAAVGWYYEWHRPLSSLELAACVKHVKASQQDSIRGMRAGDERERRSLLVSKLTTVSVKYVPLPKHPWEQDRVADDGARPGDKFFQKG